MRAHHLLHVAMSLALSVTLFGCDDDSDDGPTNSGGNGEAAGGSDGGGKGLARLFGQGSDENTNTPRAPEAAGGEPMEGEADPREGGEPAQEEAPAPGTPASAECLSVCGELVACLNDLCDAGLAAGECESLCVGVGEAELAEVPTCEALRMVSAADLCEELFGDAEQVNTPERSPEPTDPPEQTDPEPVDPEEEPEVGVTEPPPEVFDLCCSFYDCASDCLGDGVCILESCDPICGALPDAEGVDCATACGAMGLTEEACF